MGSSRRAFLTQLSTAAGLGLLSQVPGRRLWALSPHELAPDLEEALLRELALVAIDAARAAGATFADIRIGVGQSYAVRCRFTRAAERSRTMLPPSLGLVAGYGIRAVVNGAWGFAAGYELDRADVARAARTAVGRARANRLRQPRALELAPVPRVVDGRWAVPIAEDPFLVPAGGQADRQLAALEAVAAMPEVQAATTSFAWHRANRVFASTDGTLLLQRTAFSMPGATVSARAGEQYPTVFVPVEELQEGPYGYEAVTRVDLPTVLRRTAERAIELSKRPRTVPTSAEVGRFDLVLSGRAMVQVLVGTLVQALNAERALGYRTNQAGTSFAAPPLELLGKYQVGSPLLTVRADRTRQHGAATMAWDDEGATTAAFTLVQDGTIVDYLTGRQTAAELAGWYRSRGEPVRSHGCASGGAAREYPRVGLPNLTLAPAKGTASMDDLIADTRRGFYLEDVWGSSDQQLLSGQFAASEHTREIRNGKLGGRIKDLAFQFITPTFWKSLDALGGPAAAITTLVETGMKDPLQTGWASVSTVPARFRGINVLNVGRTA